MKGQSMGALSGGAYSLFRAILGLYLCFHFLHLLPYGPELFSDEGLLPDAGLSPYTRVFPNVLTWFDSPLMVQSILGAAGLASLALAFGWRDRVAALLLWYVWACLLGRNPLISNPSLPYVGLLLVVHALLPAAPYGSFAARGRPDPGAGWRLDPGLLRVVWILLAVGYTYSGLAKLSSPSWQDGSALGELLGNPLARLGPVRDGLMALPEWAMQLACWGTLAAEILFAPLALFRRTRGWAWLALVLMHVGILFTVDFADLSMGMLLVHLFVFDPGWIKARACTRDEPEVIYYDGQCGLCHGAIRFLLAEDDEGAFHFAPLQGDTLAERLPEGLEKDLPDSILVQTHEGRWLMKSDAVRHITRGLGGVWGAMGWALGIVPRPLRDLAYDAIAAVRLRLFTKPSGACPMVSSQLMRRFLP